MTDMPNKNHLVSTTTTELEFQTALGDFYDVVNQMAGQGVAEALTITAGAVTPAKAHFVVDTEEAAASDDLDNILPNTIGAKLLLVRSSSDARVVVLRHNQSGTGKLMLRGAANASLTSTSQMIVFRWDAANSAWVETYRNWGYLAPPTYNPSADRTALGLGTSAVKNTGTSGDAVPLLNTACTWAESIAVSAAAANRTITVSRTGTGASSVFIGTLSGAAAIGSVDNVPLRFYTNNTERMSIAADGGALVGSPTGGSQGAGTLNVQSGIYLNGTPVELGSGRLLNKIYYTCPSQTCTISVASPAVITYPGAGRNRPQNGCPVRLTTTGALPTGLSTGVTYYVVNISNLALTPGGSPIATTGAGSGTHTIQNAPYEKGINNPSFVQVTVVGGTGGRSNSSSSSGGGGGGGARKIIAASALETSETVTSGVAGDGSSVNGGTSSFGSHCSATGGANSIGAPMAAGGYGTGGDLNVKGQKGLVASSNGHSGGTSAFGLSRGGESTAQAASSVGEVGIVVVEEFA